MARLGLSLSGGSAVFKFLVKYPLDDAASGRGHGAGGRESGLTFQLHGGESRLSRRATREARVGLRLLRLQNFRRLPTIRRGRDGRGSRSARQRRAQADVHLRLRILRRGGGRRQWSKMI